MQSPRNWAVYEPPHMRSRWAPASLPPISTSGSFQSCCRNAQWASSSSVADGQRTVRSSSTRTMSTRQSNGSIASLLGDVTDAAPPNVGVVGMEGVPDAVVGAVHEAGEHPDVAADPGEHRGADVGISQGGHPGIERQLEDLSPPGQEVERAVGAEAHVHGHDHRHRERRRPVRPGLVRVGTGASGPRCGRGRTRRPPGRSSSGAGRPPPRERPRGRPRRHRSHCSPR